MNTYSSHRLTISMNDLRDCTIIRIEGAIDSFNSRLVSEFVNKNRFKNNIIVNLEKLESINASGINALYTIATVLGNESGKKCILVEVPCHIKQVLKILRAKSKLFIIEDTEIDALRNIRENDYCDAR